MDKKVTFTEIKRTVYEVTDVSPEDGVNFDYTRFMEIRKRHGMKITTRETHCKKCKKEFQDGDRMYLIITNNGNFFVCKDCAKKFRRSLGKKDYCKPENQHLNWGEK
jgi:RNase P subunit RPR2